MRREHYMHVKMKESRSASKDGISASLLEKGEVHEVPSALGRHLIENDWATEVESDSHWGQEHLEGKPVKDKTTRTPEDGKIVNPEVPEATREKLTPVKGEDDKVELVRPHSPEGPSPTPPKMEGTGPSEEEKAVERDAVLAEPPTAKKKYEK